MTCGYSKEILALYIEDDLPPADAVRTVEHHVAACPACQEYCEQLRKTQAFIRSRFMPVAAGSVSQQMLSGMRHSVMSQIEPVRQSLGWSVRLERFLLLGLRRPRFAAIGIAVLIIVSASLLGQIRHAAAPVDYAQLVFVGNSNTDEHHNVYMNPDAYREYTRSGRFPQGTIVVKKASAQLQMSAKDAGCLSCHKDQL